MGSFLAAVAQGFTFDPTEYLPMVQAGTDSQLSTPEFHLLPLNKQSRSQF
jgi:hypothetical protein